MIIETDAIVLHRMKYKNSSLIARIFTKNEGKISIILNGASKQKGNLFGVIEPSNIIQLNYYKRKPGTLQTCKNARLLSNNLLIKQDILKLSTALAIVETIDKTMQENDVQSEIYVLGKKLINELSTLGINPKIILVYFLFHISNFLGFMIDVNDIQLSKEEKLFLRDFYNIDIESLIHVNNPNIDLLDIIILIENHIKHHLKLNKNIQSLVFLKELNYG